MKVHLESNINDNELTVESCSEIIDALSESLANVRDIFYSKLLGFSNLKKALIAVGIVLLLYLLTENIIFIYMAPIILLGFFIASIITAQYLTNKTKKAIILEIQKIKAKRESLLNKNTQ